LISKNANMLFELAKEGQMHENATVMKVLKSLSVYWDDDIAEDIEQLLILRAFPRKTTDPFYPSTHNKGEINIGICNSQIIGVSKEELTQGMLVVGRSGSGKTNLFTHLMKQFIVKGIPTLNFDVKKDYRHLLKEHPDIIVIPWEYLRLNPLKPPRGVSAIRWLQEFTEVFGHSQALLSGSKNFVMARLHRLFDLYGVFEGSDHYPTMLEFQEILNNTKYSMISKDARYLETVRNRVNTIILAFDKVFDCEDGLPLEELLNRNVIIEMDGLMEDAQSFIIEILLVWIYNYRLAQGHRGELRHVILFDEAKKIFDRNKEHMVEAGIPIIDIITDRAREFGEALIVADQEPTKLTDSIKANSYTKITLSLGSGKDIVEMSRCMGLNTQQTDHSHCLKVGKGIIKISGEVPGQITIPYVPIKKDVVDKEVIDDLNKKMENYHITPRIRPDKFEDFIIPSIKVSKSKKESLSDEAVKLLEDINQHQISPLKDRYNRINMTSSKGTRAKKELVSNGLVKEVEVNTKEKGGRPKLLEATDKGNDHLLLNGHEPNGNNGKGSLKHRYWQDKIKKYYEKWGCKAQIEVFIGKKSVDVVVIFPNKKSVAVEVAMSHHHQVENIKKNLEFDFDEIIIACKDEKVKEMIIKNARQVIGKSLPGNIRFCLLKQFNGSNGDGKPTDSESTLNNKRISKSETGLKNLEGRC